MLIQIYSTRNSGPWSKLFTLIIMKYFWKNTNFEKESVLKARMLLVNRMEIGEEHCKRKYSAWQRCSLFLRKVYYIQLFRSSKFMGLAYQSDRNV